MYKCSSLRTVLQLFVTFFVLYLNVFLRIIFLSNFIQCSSLSGRDKAWHPYETITALCILMFKFLVSKWEGKTFWTERLEAFLVINHFLISSCMQFWVVTVMCQILFCVYCVAWVKQFYWNWQELFYTLWPDSSHMCLINADYLISNWSATSKSTPMIPHNVERNVCSWQHLYVMIIIIINFITFLVHRYNSRCILVLRKFFPIPNRINVFIVLISDWHNSAEFDQYPLI